MTTQNAIRLSNLEDVHVNRLPNSAPSTTPYVHLSLINMIEAQTTPSSSPLHPPSVVSPLGQHPLGAPLDILVDQRADVGEHETTDVEAEKLGRVSGAELETDMRG